ncbi:hypothetical protein AWY79_06595 [Pseudodesulfovibrio indicus]|uniref:Uncharacterized protein n=1 Tax=Pseudodesulfovibrio indicus TaxID=1716143 RepID=A0ABN4LW86_9BACT|nr:hypothetical protein AWY79_06595 [Pseudodesulfovibrio indicus]
MTIRQIGPTCAFVRDWRLFCMADLAPGDVRLEQIMVKSDAPFPDPKSPQRGKHGRSSDQAFRTIQDSGDILDLQCVRHAT